MTGTVPLPQRADTSIGDVDHLCCSCDTTVALCGLDLTGVPEGPEFDQVCPLCVWVLESGVSCPGGGRRR